ncbi:MAG: hypothetical protein H6656_21950 [Ardenticatenaceae bacterium]|nr:hypothetical protein [Ardenticatenaceae bacterium]
MIRSRLLFISLLLAYLGVTPAGVYTCACLMPADPAPEQLNLEDIANQPTNRVDTAVAAVLSYLTISFMLAAAFLFFARRAYCTGCPIFWLEPYRFCLPPPTPPPAHFA